MRKGLQSGALGLGCMLDMPVFGHAWITSINPQKIVILLVCHLGLAFKPPPGTSEMTQ